MRGSPKPSEPDLERLHKRIGRSGLASRRAAERMIAEGRVEVNGVTVTEMGIKVGPDDEVRVDGRPLEEQKLYYLVMNKPAGHITTMSDPHGRASVTNLLPNLGVTLKPVGRLDMETEGLLIFTNDGAFANRLAHPRYGIEKEYVAIVRGHPDEKALSRLRKGVFLPEEATPSPAPRMNGKAIPSPAPGERGQGERVNVRAGRRGRGGRKTAPAQVSIVGEAGSEQTQLRLIIHEGRKRQVRLMCEAVGHPVISLKRVRIGPLHLSKMRKGECRMLGSREVGELKKSLGMD